MSQQELLKRVLDALAAAGGKSMITGSLASSLQGEPRSTHDIDLVVEIPAHSLSIFLGSFPLERYYVDPESVKRAVFEKSFFNLIDFTTGLKVDFWLLTSDPFDQSRFDRRIERQFLGISAQFSTPEDTILSKLRWSKLSGGSEKQFVDALRVYEVQHADLDHAYLQQWAERLKVTDLLDRLKREAVIPGF